MQATMLGIQLSGAPPLLQRFWGTVCQCDETVYLILFINDRCLVLPFRDELTACSCKTDATAAATIRPGRPSMTD